jgi:hypothetical protein
MGTHVECQVKATGCPLTEEMVASGAPWFCGEVRERKGEGGAGARAPSLLLSISLLTSFLFPLPLVNSQACQQV